jgi:hypothetical protein
MFHSLEQRRQLAELERELLLRRRLSRIESWPGYERPERRADRSPKPSPAAANPPSTPMPA